jgi:ABC-type nitrate/sulfonate/bicarbonate transport system substrate-binding protein
MRLAWVMMLGLVAALPCRAQTTVQQTGAQQTGALELNSFGGASNLPLWAADHIGAFQRHGVAVTLSHPKGSVDQFQGVAAGRYPVISTAFDNIIAYHEGQGAPEVGAIPDLVAVAGIDGGFLTLMATPAIGSIADLKGRTLAVDALSTGFSFALKAILARNGVAPDQVSYVAVGSSDGRLKAMQDGRAVAALLTLPADLVARDGGAKALTTVRQELGHYEANILATRAGWARDHGDVLVGLLRGYRDGLDWTLAPANRAAALELMHQEMPSLAPALLERVYAELTDKRDGLVRDMRIDRTGAATVLMLRATYAPPPHKLQVLAAYIDTKPLSLARRQAAKPGP